MGNKKQTATERIKDWATWWLEVAEKADQRDAAIASEKALRELIEGLTREIELVLNHTHKDDDVVEIRIDWLEKTLRGLKAITPPQIEEKT